MKPRFFWTLLFFFVAEISFGQNILSWNFDWDDNVVYMPTKVVLFNELDHNTTVKISTREFAVVRNYLENGIMMGGPYKGFGIDDDRAKGTFRYFSDEGFEKGFNIFKRQVDDELNNNFESAKGPVWKAFVRSLSTKTTAKWTTIITARAHEPQSIYSALEGLQQRGMIKYLPELEHIFPVSNIRFADPSTHSTSATKVLIQFQILDAIEAEGVDSETKLITDQDAIQKAPLHVWGFSDDDWENYQKTREILGQEVNLGRWPHIKIVIFFTGKNNPDHAEESSVIMNDGHVRSLLKKEIMEIGRIAFKKDSVGVDLVPN